MGYTTRFEGTFKFSRPLTLNEKQELLDISNERHDETCMPSIWCDWVPTKDGTGLEWNGTEKFYNYDGWLQFLIDEVFSLWGVSLLGTVKYRGERFDDVGTLTVVDGKVQRSVW